MSQTIHRTAHLGKRAINSLPTIIQNNISDCKRVVLIANNPSISIDTLNNILDKDDMLVLFNNFIHADYFANDAIAKTLPKLLFFRQIGDSNLHFGLPPRHNNVPFIEQMSEHADIGFLLSNIHYQFSTLADDPSPDDDPIDETVELSLSKSLSAKLRSRTYSQSIADNHDVVADYPIFKGIHSSAASSGFFIYRLMLTVRLYLLAEQKQAFEIVLIGFNHDKKTDFFWHGHNWAFEREEMTNLPEGVRIIKQY